MKWTQLGMILSRRFGSSRGHSAAVAVAVAVVCLLAKPVCGQTVIAEFDYFNSGGTSWGQPFYSNYLIMQTFTPIASGMLTSVDVTVHQSNASTTAPVTAKIFAVTEVAPNGLQPTGTALATGSLLSTNAQFATMFITWKSIPMTSTALTAGVTYGLVVDAAGTNQDYMWYSKMGGDLYTGGNLAVSTGSTFAQQTYDVSFRINVAAVPEPPVWAALVVGFSTLGLARWRGLRGPGAPRS